MMIKTVSLLLALVAFCSTTMVSSAPPMPLSDSSLIQSLTSFKEPTSRRSVSYSFASAPPRSPACDSCLEANADKYIPDCHNVTTTQGATFISDLTDAERKCICTWADVPSTTWSQGCVTPTLCSQNFVDYLAGALHLLEPQACFNTPTTTSVSPGSSFSGVTGRVKKSNGGAVAAAALVMGAAAIMF